MNPTVSHLRGEILHHVNVTKIAANKTLASIDGKSKICLKGLKMMLLFEKWT